jgi:nicotinamidase-related amidase
MQDISHLLVYDMQVGIKNQVKDGKTIAAKIRAILEAARTAKIRVFFTRHMSLPKELMGAFQFRMAMTWQRVDDPEKVQTWFLRDTDDKLKPSAFARPNLFPDGLRNAVIQK